jgi:hypothetical protein
MRRIFMRHIFDKIQVSILSENSILVFGAQAQDERFQADSFCSIGCELD